MRIVSINQNSYKKNNKVNFGAIAIDGFMDFPHACRSFIKVSEKYPDLTKIGFIREKYHLVSIIKTKLGSKLENKINKNFFEGKAELIDDKLAESYINDDFITKNPEHIDYYVEIAKRTLGRFEEYQKDPVNHIVDMALGIEPPQDKNNPISDAQALRKFFLGE